MAYTKTTWVNGSTPAINATNLNNIETGVGDAHDLVSTHTSNTSTAHGIDGKAPLASPALTGVPTAPTASVGTNTTQLATTAFVLANAPTPDLSAYTKKDGTTAMTYLTVGTRSGTVGNNSVSEGVSNVASGSQSHAEGGQSHAEGNYSHCEGLCSAAVLPAAHAEGEYTYASNGLTLYKVTGGIVGGYVTVENVTGLSVGNSVYIILDPYLWEEAQSSLSASITSISGNNVTLSLGYSMYRNWRYIAKRTSPTVANASHAEGYSTIAAGGGSHAEGYNSVAIAPNSHAQNQHTIAQGYCQTAIGRYNVVQGTQNSYVNTDNAFIIGNGTSNSARSNALSVDWQGNMISAGSIRSAIKTATITTTWTGSSAPYTQTITVTGLTSTDTPVISPVYSSTNATALLEKAAWNMVGKISSGTDSITVYCFETAPTQAINIQIKVV